MKVIEQEEKKRFVPVHIVIEDKGELEEVTTFFAREQVRGGMRGTIYRSLLEIYDKYR